MCQLFQGVNMKMSHLLFYSNLFKNPFSFTHTFKMTKTFCCFQCCQLFSRQFITAMYAQNESDN